MNELEILFQKYTGAQAGQCTELTASGSNRRYFRLEAENIELKAKVKELENKLKHFGELSETLSEMGFMPR